MTAKILPTTTDARLRVLLDGDEIALTAAETPDADRMVRFDIAELAADTEYQYQVVLDGDSVGPVGRFRTLPAGAPAGTACSFTVALSGDALTGSAHVTFNRINELSPKPAMFIHLGDLHYENISTNSPALFHAAYDRVLRSEPQAQLYREIPTVYVWDDHDYGANNSDGTSASKPAAAAAYRSRIPHYPLEGATGIYHSFDVGRVRFVVTDQRSAASPNSDTDNSSKSMLGATQKAWFKDLLENSPGKLIVWICPRHFTSNTSAGADNWGGFSTERAEIGAHVASHCPGRVIVLSADAHVMGIDDGSNRTFGGAAFPTFQCAPLDQSGTATATFSEGVFEGVDGIGYYGTMQIADSGGATIEVTWRGHDSTGAVLVTYSFSVNV